MKTTLELLKHIREECDFLLIESKNLDRDEFLESETLRRAFSRSLEIIGEASKSIPFEFKRTNSKLDWKGMAGLRDILIHQYFGVDYELVWEVVNSLIKDTKVIIDDLVNELE